MEVIAGENNPRIQDQVAGVKWFSEIIMVVKQPWKTSSIKTVTEIIIGVKQFAKIIGGLKLYAENIAEVKWPTIIVGGVKWPSEYIAGTQWPQKFSTIITLYQRFLKTALAGGTITPVGGCFLY